MTGAEILIKKGDMYLLGKVRHSGYDVIDIFPVILSIGNTSLYELWEIYLAIRRNEFSPISIKGEIITHCDGGFIFTSPKVVTSERTFVDVVEEGENLIKQSYPDDGYLCGYKDYQIFIDIDNEEIYHIGDDGFSPLIPDENEMDMERQKVIRTNIHELRMQDSRILT